MKDTYYYDLINKYRKKILMIITILIPVIMFFNILYRNNYINIICRLDYFYGIMLFLLLIPMYIYEKCYLKEKIKIIEVLILIYLLINLLSSIFAINTDTAFFGYYNRYEGFITILFYFFYYLNITRLNKSERNSFINILIYTVIINFIFVIFQELSIYPKLFSNYHSAYPVGLTTNSDFLASLMTSSSIFFGLLYYYNKKNIYLITFIISYISLIITNVTSPFIAYITVLLIFIIYQLFKKSLNKRIILIIILSIAIYPLFNNYHLIKEIKDNINYFNNHEYYHLGHERLRIWSKTVDLIKDRPILGYGNDNLVFVYQKDQNNKVADKAHNIYLNMVVSNGIFSLIVYISILFYILKYTNYHDYIDITLLFFIITYLIQGFFNINVIEVTPYFYLVLGLLNNNRINVKQK